MKISNACQHHEDDEMLFGKRPFFKHLVQCITMLLVVGIISTGCLPKPDTSLRGVTPSIAVKTAALQTTLSPVEIMPSPTLSLISSPIVSRIEPEFTPTPTGTRLPTYTPAPSDLSGSVVFSAMDDAYHFQLFLANLETGEIRFLPHAGSSTRPVWSPDGTQIVFSSLVGDDSDLYIMDRNGRIIKRLTNYKGRELRPAWSPDGKQIAFTSNHSGNNEIYLIDVNTRDVIQLTNNAGSDFGPSWSPDGTRIAFTSDRMSEFGNDVYIMDVNGDNVERITSDRAVKDGVVWCPDGRCLVVEYLTGTRGRIHKLMILDLQSGEIRSLLSESYATAPDINEWYPSISPERGYITFSIEQMFYAFDMNNDRLYSLGIEAVDGSLYP